MVAPILTSLLSNPIALIGAASPFIINYIQRRSAERQAQVEHKASELKKANDIVGTLCDNMDLLAFYNMEAAFGLVLRGGDDLQNRLEFEQDQLAWKNYQEQLAKWNGSRTRNRANVYSYFGQTALTILTETQDDFAQIENMVDATYFMRTSSQFYLEDSESLEKEYFPVREELLKKIEKLNNQMIIMIQNMAVGSLKVK